MIDQLIRRRRAIYPKTYLPGKPIARDLIERLLENANWAPTHKMTEPWRFRVFHSEESRRQLGAYLVDYYQKNTAQDEFSAEKMKKMADNPLRSGAVIAICIQPDPTAGLPEWEEVAAVACAVQNMWLTCTEIGLGCYWSTPSAILQAKDLLQLQPDERCLGLFYLGWHDLPELPGKRGPVENKTRWF